MPGKFMPSMYFIIFGIVQDFTPKMLEIAFQDSRFQNFPAFDLPPPHPKKNEGLATPLTM